MSKPREYTIEGQVYREVVATHPHYSEVPEPPREARPPRDRAAQEPLPPLEPQALDPAAEPPASKEPPQAAQEKWGEAVFACVGYARDIDRLATELKEALEKTYDGRHYEWLSLEEANALKDDLAKGAEAMETKVKRLKARQVEQV